MPLLNLLRACNGSKNKGRSRNVLKAFKRWNNRPNTPIVSILKAAKQSEKAPFCSTGDSFRRDFHNGGHAVKAFNYLANLSQKKATPEKGIYLHS